MATKHRLPPVIPEIARAYQNDPRTRLGVQAMATGASNAPVAEGKYAMADGIARALQGGLGGYIDRKQQDKYGEEQTKTIADQQDILRRLAATAPAQPPAPLASPIAPPAIPQAAPSGPQAAAAALGALPAPQTPPGPAMGLPPAIPTPPQAGGAPVRRPFGPSAALAANVPSHIIKPVVEEVADAPAPVARPTAPTAEGPTRSRMLAAAYATIENGNPYLFARGQDMLDQGNAEQTKLNEAAIERAQKLKDMGYQTDLGVFADAASADRSNTYAERREAKQRNYQTDQLFKSQIFQHGESESDHAFQATENAKNRAAARINASIAASARSNGKPLSWTAAEKLAKNASGVDAIERIQKGFDNKYVGHVVTGNMGVAINKLTGADKPAADWWQDYQMWVSNVRHDLYGASLTANEKAAFEKVIVTPQMNPTVAASNLARQKAIAETGLARVSRAAAAAYGPEAVLEAIGRDPSSLSTAAPVSAPADVPQRKPGETVSQYLKRTGG